MDVEDVGVTLKLIVAESGYRSIDDLKTLASVEFSAVLIGEGLATNPSLVNQLRLV